LVNYTVEEHTNMETTVDVANGYFVLTLAYEASLDLD
jgi:hypothetical protein